nr:hypothetical protein [Tanacetum cinerariifolium]
MLTWLVLQGLRETNELKHGALSLYMGNGMRATVEAIKSFNLLLPSDLIIPFIPLPGPVSSQAARDGYNALYNTQNEEAYLMLEQAKQELFNIVKAFHACKQEEGHSDYDHFVQNYNMYNMRKTIAELNAILKLHEKGIPKKAETPAVLAIREIPPPPKRDNSSKDSVCHHCKEVGHWRKNCPSYQAELKKRKNANMASTS